MSDNQPGFYALAHVTPTGTVEVRDPTPMSGRDKAIADAIALLERAGYVVTWGGAPLANGIAATIEGRYIPDQPGA